MRPDLQGLKLTKTELKRLSGVDVEAILKFSPRSLLTLDIRRDAPWVLKRLPSIALGIVLAAHGAIGKLFYLRFPTSLVILCLEMAGAIVMAKYIQFLWIKKHIKPSLLGLIQDVQRFNSIIKSIDINDQIELAGNPDVSIENRKQVIEALKLTREDLTRALKTEKILRKNQQFIASNPDLFSNNLTALAALQVSDRASEHGRLLNEALQIALNAQEEMRKLAPYGTANNSKNRV